MIADLRLDQAPVDPTTLTADELVKEVQRVVKALLGYGARMPKELMLYVKNLVFLDGAIARLAPDLDLIGEIADISAYFARTHGERLGRELGIDHREVEINLDGVKAELRRRRLDRDAHVPRPPAPTGADQQADAGEGQAPGPLSGLRPGSPWALGPRVRLAATRIPPPAGRRRPRTDRRCARRRGR